MRYLVTIINTYINVRDLGNHILIGMIALNLIWLCGGYFKPISISINNFKSPETDSVVKDLGRLLYNIKVNSDK